MAARPGPSSKQTLYALGQAAFLTDNGSVVVREDLKIESGSKADPHLSKPQDQGRKAGMSNSRSQENKSPSQLIDARIEELGDWRGICSVASVC